MSTWLPPWSAPGQFKLTLLPPTRASNSSRPGDLPARIDGRAARGLAGTTAPAISRRSGLAGLVPARRRPVKPPLRAHSARCTFGAWPDSAGPARQPTTRQPRRPEPFGPPQPAQPQPYRPAPQEERTRQASPDPTRPQRPRPAEYGEARESLPAWVGEQSEHGYTDTQWQPPRRRRRTGSARLRRNPNLRQ
jgi:hypothetical protein